MKKNPLTIKMNMNFKAKMRELTIEDALKYTQSVINTMQDPVIIMNDDLTVALVSLSFCRTFKVKSKDTSGQFVYDLGSRQWDIPKLRELLEEILPKTTSFDDFEIEHDFPDIGRRTMLLNANRIYLKSNRTKLIIMTIKDITERRKIEELQIKVNELESRLKKNAES